MTSLEHAYGTLMARISRCVQDGNWAPVRGSARNLAREAVEAVWSDLHTVSEETLEVTIESVLDQIDELGGNNGNA